MDKDDVKNSQTAIFLIVIVIILSIAGFISYDKFVSEKPDDIVQETYFYNNFEFLKENGLWTTGLQTENDIYRLFVHYGPRDLEDIKTDKVDRNMFMNKTVFLTIDPTSEQQPYIAVAASEIGSSLFRVLGSTVYTTCTVNDSACVDRYIIDCDTTNRPVVKMQIANETSVVLDDNCVIISGNSTDLIRAADKFLFQMYGIMN